jgi:hypothetical protein
MTPARPELAAHEMSSPGVQAFTTGTAASSQVPRFGDCPARGRPWFGLGMVSWVVERALAWLHAHKRLAIRWEYRADPHEGLVSAVGGHC